MCRLLVDDLHVDPERCNRSGTTARAVAETNKQLSAAAVLEAAETKKGNLANSLGARLYIAVQSGTFEEATRLLEARAQPSSVLVSGGENLSFHAAAREQGALQMLMLLVE